MIAYTYLEREHYDRAKENGVSPSTLYQRVNHYGWELERAITTPPKTASNPYSDKWSVVAEKNGIKRDTFTSRIRRGWSEKDAATISVRAARVVAALESAKKRTEIIPPEYIERARNSGVPLQTIRWRLKNKWSIEDALTTPPIPRTQRTQQWVKLKRSK